MHGHCLCGSVSFDADPPEPETHVCHCEMCRRWTGSASFSVSVPTDRITFTGTDRIRTRQTSDWAERAWCDARGSTLYYRVTLDPDATYEMALGLFDQPDACPLTKEIYIDRKPGIYALTGTHRRLTEAEHEAEVEARYAALPQPGETP